MVQTPGNPNRAPDSPGSTHRRSWSQSSSQSALPLATPKLVPDRTNSPRPSSLNRPSTKRRSATGAPVTGPSPLPEPLSGPAIAVLEKEARPSSELSLPTFRREKPAIYYEGGEPLAQRLVRHDRIPQDPKLGATTYIAKGGRGNIFVIGFKLEDDVSTEFLAVKLVLIENEEDERAAMREYEMLRSIEHNHIIATLGFYRQATDQIGILLYPAAPRTLAEDIKAISDHNRRQDEDRKEDGKSWKAHLKASRLLSYFSCLCNAVLYLHRLPEPIKHKDIKPANILVDAANTVILADFDLAAQYPDKDKVISHGATGNTDQYASESVAKGYERGFDRDINCLGFVFLEMATVVFGESQTNFSAHLKKKHDPAYVNSKRNNSTNPQYRHCLRNGSIKEWIDHLLNLSTQRPAQVAIPGEGEKKRDVARKFLDTIHEMMEARKEDEGLLWTALQFFSSVCEKPCEHCIPLQSLEQHRVTKNSLTVSAYTSSLNRVSMSVLPNTGTRDPEGDSGESPVKPDVEEDIEGLVNGEEVPDVAPTPPVPEAPGTLVPSIIAPGTQAWRDTEISESTLETRSEDLANAVKQSKPHRRRTSAASGARMLHQELTNIPEAEDQNDVGSKANLVSGAHEPAESVHTIGDDIDSFRPQGPSHNTRVTNQFRNHTRLARSPQPRVDSNSSLLAKIQGNWACVWDPKHNWSEVRSKRRIRKDCKGQSWHCNHVTMPRGSGRFFQIPDDDRTVDLTQTLTMTATFLRKMGVVRSLLIITHSEE